MTGDGQRQEFANVRAETAEVAEHVRGAAARASYTILIATLTALMAAGASILTTVLLTTRSEHKLCAIVILSDDTYHRTPPVTDIGRAQAKNFSQLRKDLGCAPYKGES